MTLNMYYVRRPDGTHTIAFSPTRFRLWELLGEGSDGASPDVLLYQYWPKVPYNKSGYAFDFRKKYRPAEDEHDDDFRFWVAEGFGIGESKDLREALAVCMDLRDEDMIPGSRFFTEDNPAKVTPDELVAVLAARYLAETAPYTLLEKV